LPKHPQSLFELNQFASIFLSTSKSSHSLILNVRYFFSSNPS